MPDRALPPDPALEQQKKRAELRRAFEARDATRLRELFGRHPEARAMIDEPLFPFDSPALAHFSGGEDVTLIDVLLEFGADPDRRTDWWAGGFHPLHGASPAVTERLIRAGAAVDACAASHLDRIDLLRAILDADPARVDERGGDGQTPLHFARSPAVRPTPRRAALSGRPPGRSITGTARAGLRCRVRTPPTALRWIATIARRSIL